MQPLLRKPDSIEAVTSRRPIAMPWRRRLSAACRSH